MVDRPDFLAGGGVMGASMRAHDWTGSPLGEPEAWPSPLRMTVSLMLGSAFPMFVAWGPELGFLYNDAYSEVLGAKHPAALGRPFEAIWAEIWPDIEPLVLTAMAGKATFFEDLPLTIMRRGQPEATWFTFSYSPVREEDGHVRGMLCCCVETTAKMHAQADLRALNADLERQVTERSRERSLTWQVSSDLLGVANGAGFFERTNPAWQAVLGWSETEIARTPLLELVHPDDVTSTTAAFRQLRSGLPVLRFDNRYRVKDGGYRWLSWVAVPEGDLFYCSARDVTEEKQRIAALAERTAERDRLWTLSEDMLARANYEGMMSAVSPAWTRVLGWSEAELLSRPYATFMHPDDMEPTLAALGGMGDTTRPTRFENRIATRDGAWKPIEWTVAPEPDGVNFIAVGRDLSVAKARESELAAAQDALRQAQKLEAVGQLTGGVAHDFNNLLTVIKSSTDLLKRPDLAEERRTRYVAAISDTVDRAAKLTSQLLAFARRQSLKPEVFDAAASVRAIGEMMGTLTGSRIRIVTQLPDDPCFLDADPNQFDTALVNMAVNARDAMGGEGQLTFAVDTVEQMPAVRSQGAVRGAFVAVSISDTGSGIPEDQLERIFEPFFTTKGVGQGTGLGLSQVFGFAKQSGGEVTVVSRVGKGSTFTLYLPRVAGVERPMGSGEPEPLVDGHGTCVLVVEDNRDVGLFATQTLAELGYGTVWAANAEEALAELAKDADRFDVVFTDVVMPGMNGIDLAHRIRDEHHDLPVLLASGYSHVLAQNGTYGFELLHKPYSVEDLSRLLRKVATWQRRKRILGR